MARPVAREPLDDIQIGILSLRDDSRFVLIGRDGTGARSIIRSVLARPAQGCPIKRKMKCPCLPWATVLVVYLDARDGIVYTHLTTDRRRGRYGGAGCSCGPLKRVCRTHRSEHRSRCDRLGEFFLRLPSQGCTRVLVLGRTVEVGCAPPHGAYVGDVSVKGNRDVVRQAA